MFNIKRPTRPNGVLKDVMILDHEITRCDTVCTLTTSDKVERVCTFTKITS